MRPEMRPGIRPTLRFGRTRAVPDSPCHPRGFTLVEVLVALAIVAIALVAGVRAVDALWATGDRQVDAFLGMLCAENAQSELRLSAQYAPVGRTEVSCVQADRTYLNRIDIQPTPNPNFRRVEVQVLRDDRPVLRVSAILGDL